jgi:hypothetical protein
LFIYKKYLSYGDRGVKKYFFFAVYDNFLSLKYLLSDTFLVKLIGSIEPILARMYPNLAFSYFSSQNLQKDKFDD